jgi:hypothetical protein
MKWAPAKVGVHHGPRALQDEAANELGVAERQFLGDGAAAGEARHVSGGNVDRPEQLGCVVRHHLHGDRTVRHRRPTGPPVVEGDSTVEAGLDVGAAVCVCSGRGEGAVGGGCGVTVRVLVTVVLGDRSRPAAAGAGEEYMADGARPDAPVTLLRRAPTTPMSAPLRAAFPMQGHRDSPSAVHGGHDVFISCSENHRSTYNHSDR